jgi:Holliday junction DNA helicase RuvA
MISTLRGTVVHVGPEGVVVEVGGFGLSVAVPGDVVRTTHTGEAISLHTHLVVREDALSLFGFTTREELETFVLLLQVTGVGPKSALGVLSQLSVDQIADAVAHDDDAPFRRVSGIGPKTAKLIVLQLAGKIAPTVRPAARGAGGGASDIGAQVVQALIGLGWPERVATDAVTTTLETSEESERATVPALLRLTLAALGPARAGGARG